MPRFDIHITIHQTHRFAISADTNQEAMQQALASLDGHDAEETETEISVERGVW
jgi:hypothetical protein